MGGNSNLPVVGLEELLPESLSVVSSLPRFKHPQAWDDPSSSLRSKGMYPTPTPTDVVPPVDPMFQKREGGVYVCEGTTSHLCPVLCTNR